MPAERKASMDTQVSSNVHDEIFSTFTLKFFVKKAFLFLNFLSPFVRKWKKKPESPQNVSQK